MKTDDTVPETRMAFFATTGTAPLDEQDSPLEGHHYSTLHQTITSVCGSKILVVRLEAESRASVVELSVPGDNSSVQCAAMSPSRRHLCASTDSKTLTVWQQQQLLSGGGGEESSSRWQQIGSKELPKRAMALCFTLDEKWVVVADKTGEVYRYSLESLDHCSGKHLLGHFSILLDMILSPDNLHIITCDRNEKIRVSKFPNSYNIETYCLSHTEFVSSLCLCPARPSVLLSASGDGTVRSWQWKDGTPLGSWRWDGGCGGSVVKVCCSSHKAPLVVIMLESSSKLHLLSLSVEGMLSCVGEVVLPVSPWDITINASNHLWVCLNDSSAPVLCYELDPSAAPVQNSCEDQPILKALCKWDLFKGLDVVPARRNWEELRKQKFDNTGAYMARKEERTQANLARKQTLRSHLESPDLELSKDPPPIKKSKLEH